MYRCGRNNDISKSVLWANIQLVYILNNLWKRAPNSVSIYPDYQLNADSRGAALRHWARSAPRTAVHRLLDPKKHIGDACYAKSRDEIARVQGQN
jgi:hypothetical protein